MAGGVAVDQGTEADPMGNAGAGEAFRDLTDGDGEHGRAAIQ